MGIKLAVQLGIIFIIIAGLTYTINVFTIIKKSKIVDFEEEIVAYKIKVMELDSTIYSLQQDVDMKVKTDREFQTVILELSKENKELKGKITNSSILIEKIEANGNVRYFEKPFLSKCYRE